MLPKRELRVLSVRQGDENHQYNCRVLVQPTSQTVTIIRWSIKVFKIYQ